MSPLCHSKLPPARGNKRSFAAAVVAMLLCLAIMPLARIREKSPDSPRNSVPMEPLPQMRAPAPKEAESHCASDAMAAPPAPKLPTAASLLPELPFRAVAAARPSLSDMENLKPSMDTIQLPSAHDATFDDVRLFEISELDSVPALIHVPEFRFPPELSRHGVHEGQVIALVRVDATGRVTLLSVAKCSHPELLPAIRASVERALFQPPTRNGKAVTMRYFWKLHLQDEALEK